MSRPSKRTGDLALAIYGGGIFITIVAMFVAVLISSPRPVVVVIQGQQPAAGPVATGAGAPDNQATPPAGTATPAAPTTPPAPAIQVTDVPAVPAADDVFAAEWEKAPTLNVPLLPQNIARPLLGKQTIPSVDVQALRDSSRVAWRVSWAAAEPSSNVDADRFSDAVALQFSLQPGTPFLMGGPGMPVRILHWKALWQKDVTEHYQQVEDVHPNYNSDFYWFASAAFPSPYATSLDNAQARQFMPAMNAGNPMANPGRTKPVEELVAEGFGTSTTVRDTTSGAFGEWKDGRWTVVFDRPLSPDDPLAAAMAAGKADALAFAVWDGSAKNVGGVKHFSNWIPVKLKP